jgi:hypothetical protein
MHTSSCKGLISYHNINGITIIRKHVEVEQNVLYVKYSKEVTSHA